MELPMSLWTNLPVFGQMYIKPVLDKINSVEGLVSYHHLLLSEAEITNNEARKLCLETVARFIFEDLTNVSWNTRNFETLITDQ